MKFSTSLLVASLAVAASASPLNVRAGKGAFRGGKGGGFAGDPAGAGAGGAGAGAGAASSAAAASSAVASASVASVAAASSAAGTATAVASASVASVASASSAAVDTATAVASASAVATSTDTAAATSTAAAGNNAGNGTAAGGDDPQSSLTLLQSVIATGFANNGQEVAEAGQVPSLTSTNNFINFCATVPQLPITNGKQITAGSCNPAPMGIIAAFTNMPSSKFVFPSNGAVVPANTNFTVQLAVRNLVTGNFVNANESFFAAPQQTDAASGNIKGHSHITIDPVPSANSTDPTDPTKFAWFKGLNAAADANGILSATVAGLPAGAYRVASINTAANHQPALVAVAQHGALDDMVYFTVA
ncbi:hypothetical protein DICSQDRAFT_136115, partial [Dichomitus squalens LYAD-421 SS1]